MVSGTSYSLKAVCMKLLLSLRVYKLQEDWDRPGRPASHDSCHEPCCCCHGIQLPLLLCNEFSVKLSLCADEIPATWLAQSHRALKCWGCDANPANLAPRSVSPHPKCLTPTSHLLKPALPQEELPAFLQFVNNVLWGLQYGWFGIYYLIEKFYVAVSTQGLVISCLVTSHGWTTRISDFRVVLRCVFLLCTSTCCAC